VSVDDSLGKKDRATRHLEVVDYHYNHTESSRKKPTYANGYVYMEVHIQIGPLGFLFDTRVYLREKKVRRLNRGRTSEQRRALSQQVCPGPGNAGRTGRTPAQCYQTYVLFDSWYGLGQTDQILSAATLACDCALKGNRRIDKSALTNMTRRSSTSVISVSRWTLQTPLKRPVLTRSVPFPRAFGRSRRRSLRYHFKTATRATNARSTFVCLT